MRYVSVGERCRCVQILSPSVKLSTGGNTRGGGLCRMHQDGLFVKIRSALFLADVY